MLNKKELNAIRKKLPTNAYQRIADRTGLSTSMVGKALRDPKHFNATIIEKAIEVIEDYKMEMELLKVKIKQVTS